MMQINTYTHWSTHLTQQMEMKSYGHAGKPMLVFPTQGGRFFEYEDFGMIEACRPFIDEGTIRVFTVDSIDNQSWCNETIHPSERAKRHEHYDRYIVEEVVPLIHSQTQGSYEKLLTTGCSMGGYHCTNFFFRHPDLFDTLIAISGVYRLKLFIDDYMDERVYFNTPLAYLNNLVDPWYLHQYRASQIIMSVGQGDWEDEMLADTHQIKQILHHKQVPNWIDFWGHDVNHDWPWWRIQVPYFLSHLRFNA